VTSSCVLPRSNPSCNVVRNRDGRALDLVPQTALAAKRGLGGESVKSADLIDCRLPNGKLFETAVGHDNLELQIQIQAGLDRAQQPRQIPASAGKAASSVTGLSLRCIIRPAGST
jgi:hypothetical protein